MPYLVLAFHPFLWVSASPDLHPFWFRKHLGRPGPSTMVAGYPYGSLLSCCL